ncbi:hypothetical protein GF420_15600 [candidate division GN15 bacterium]|nr:hypothetical protein [candidate division GN15 bacterium]
MKNVIACLLVLGIIAGVAPAPVQAQTDLEAKIDSLFVIASSGEVRFRDQNEPAMDSIAALGRPAVPILIDKFTTKSARERWTIIWILERIGSEAVPDLVEALERPNGLVVQRVAWALGAIKDTAAVLPLAGVSDHPRWQVRNQAVLALGKIGDTRGGDAVLAALSDSIGQVRTAAVVSAGKLGLTMAVQPLIRLLADDFYGARQMAMVSLMKLDTPMVVEALGEAMADDPPLIGQLACRVLGKLGTPRAIEILHEQVVTGDQERVTAAALALVEADPLDNCGFRILYLSKLDDRLARLKVESAIAETTDEQRQP